VGTTRELHDIPQAVRVLGEDLVLFRDPEDNWVWSAGACPHRGTSLEYGDIEDGGIRCPYHGWLFNVRGQCLEMPGEPKDSKFPEKVKHLSYPAREQGGLIFAYMGPDQSIRRRCRNICRCWIAAGSGKSSRCAVPTITGLIFSRIPRSRPRVRAAPPRRLRPAVLGRSFF
jgi:nitrite reductase/ring-hydroxylating ferredoxin subunit